MIYSAFHLIRLVFFSKTTFSNPMSCFSSNISFSSHQQSILWSLQYQIENINRNEKKTQKLRSWAMFIYEGERTFLYQISYKKQVSPERGFSPRSLWQPVTVFYNFWNLACICLCYWMVSIWYQITHNLYKAHKGHSKADRKFGWAYRPFSENVSKVQDIISLLYVSYLLHQWSNIRALQKFSVSWAERN